MDRYFKDPRKFHPWRWLTKDGSIHPYGVLPFGHGARMCPGRRIAEQEILLCVSEVNFELPGYIFKEMNNTFFFVQFIDSFKVQGIFF